MKRHRWAGDVGRGAILLAVGSAGALLALKVGVPTGDLIGPIVIVGGANLLGAELGPLAPSLRQAAMLLIGAAVGGQVSRQSLRRLRKVALPAIVVVNEFKSSIHFNRGG